MLSIQTNQSLAERLLSHNAHIAVVGLGYVGLPLAMSCASAGYQVCGIDMQSSKCAQIEDGHDYIRGLHNDLGDVVTRGLLTATTKFDSLGEQDVIIICVPTPLTKNREPDISYVRNVTIEVAKHLRPGQLVILESTTYPGTTEEVMLPILAATGLKVGEDFFLAFSPERVDPGNARFHTENTPKIVGGMTSMCSRLAQIVYTQTIKEVHVASSPRVAEMVKLLENIFRCVNIALVNEMALLARRMDIDIWEVVKLASTKPYGFMPFYPGPGLGGHCIPIDPFYLTWKAREYDFQTRFIELAGEVNMNMPHHVIDIVIDALGTQHKSLRGARVMVLGAAYKKDVADARESPSIKIIELLEKRGADVCYNDHLIPELHFGEGHSRVLHSTPLDELASFDCVVLATDHSAYDFARLVREAKLLVDTRNATRARGKDHVFVL